MARAGTGSGAKTRTKKGAGAGRPKRAKSRRRKQLVVDVSLLKSAMEITGRNQSDTVNEALAALTENAAILEGFIEMRGAFPDHPDHGDNQ